MYKPYTKVATSQKMMRIIKRERLLAIIISGVQNGCATLQRTHPTPKGMRRKEMNWHQANETSLMLRHRAEDKALFDWKLHLIDETGWFPKPVIELKDDHYLAYWSDTNKLRIFYNWLHIKKEFSLLTVLKYLYTPLYPTIHYLDGGTTVTKSSLSFQMTLGKESIVELQQWLHDIFQYETVYDEEDNAIVFYYHAREKLYTDMRPTIEEYTKGVVLNG